jgi:DNA-binding PadR family transcriptional regulator
MLYYIYEIYEPFMKELSNVEIALLQIITENKEISGYEINQLLIERGYRQWAGIGTTSIYVGLKKLEKKGLLNSFVDTKKQGKGPLPKKFKVNSKGTVRFKDEIKNILIYSREKERFDLGIGSFPVLENSEVIECLIKRKKFLEDTLRIVFDKYNSQGGNKLPLQARALFQHSFVTIKEDIKFIDFLTNELNNENSKLNKEK